MKFTEPKTLRGATSPVFLANWAFAIGIFDYPIGHPRPLLSLCWSIANFFIFLGSVILAETRISIYTQSSVVTIVTYYLFTFASIASVFVFLYFGRITSKKVTANLRKLNKVNEMLSKYEIPTDYWPTYKYQIIHLASGFLFIATMLALNIFVLTLNGSFQIGHLGYVAAAHYLPTCSFTVDCTFNNIISYIGTRFKYLNAYLIQSSSQKRNTNSFPQGSELYGSLRPMTLEIHTNANSFRLANKQWMLHITRNSRKIHQELCSIARAMNEAFGVQILLSVTTSCVLITSMLYTMYNVFVTVTLLLTRSSTIVIRLVMTVSWFIFYIARIVSVARVCTMTATQAQMMGEIIHRLHECTIDRQVKKEIQAFSLLLIKNPLRFTAWGFLTLDYKMIRGIAGMVATYFVIQIQLHDTYDPKPRSTSATPHALNATY